MFFAIISVSMAPMVLTSIIKILEQKIFDKLSTANFFICPSVFEIDGRKPAAVNHSFTLWFQQPLQFFAIISVSIAPTVITKIVEHKICNKFYPAKILIRASGFAIDGREHAALFHIMISVTFDVFRDYLCFYSSNGLNIYYKNCRK